ncbi:MAG: hypothetical protein K2W92_00525 [Alphaproteobacteria bacterium]|nr:hypothetical protein [Alphaproteobacteria bacterium]
MLFSVLQNDNFSWGLQISYAVVFTAASCAFLNYAFMLDRISRGKPFILPLLGMMLSMIIASLSIAIGIFVGIALVALSLLQRQRLYVFLLLLLITFTIFAFYMHGISSVRNYTYAFNHPFECIVFFFTYLGNPFVDNYEYGIPLIFGFLGFLFFLYGCWLVWTKKVFNPGQLSLLGVSIFIVSVVGMASLGGRSEGGIAYALSSRYITPILIFWSAQILFWMSIKFEDYQDNLRKWVLIFVCSSLCLTVAVEQFKLIFNTHPINRYNLIPLGAKRKVQSNAAADALISGVYDPDALLLTMPTSEFWEVVQTSALTLKAHRRSLFSDPVALWVGSKLSDVLVVSPNVDTCQGAIEKIVPIVGSSAPNDARVMGWAWNNAARLPIERILLVNQENIIIGVASGGYASPSSSNTPKNIKSAIIGWHGFAKLPDDGIIRAFGVIRNGLEACPLSFER